jgi:hypothetical protein
MKISYSEWFETGVGLEDRENLIYAEKNHNLKIANVFFENVAKFKHLGI